MDVPVGGMPGNVGPENESDRPPWSSSDSRERTSNARASSSRASRERERSRERIPHPPAHPPPPPPPFMEMASLDNLSRDQRYYHYVQCPVLCLDSNSIHVKGVTACGLYFVFVSFVILNF